jgi:UDP-N-acetylmuramoyl-L-alanyl-D-glutamate--2,6-diaminopimelate ligase
MTVAIGRHRVDTPLLGEHNAGNLAAAVTAAILLGEDAGGIAAAVPRLRGAPGRMERISLRPVLGIVDYAHTPSALRAALATARRLRPDGRLIAVGGCGGNRDRYKRPAMGAVFATADAAILTADNPRSENPRSVVEAMLSGVDSGVGVRVELDRRCAIRLAAELAEPGDVVLVTGKGHELTHEVAGAKLPFDDRVELRAALRRRPSLRACRTRRAACGYGRPAGSPGAPGSGVTSSRPG